MIAPSSRVAARALVEAIKVRALYDPDQPRDEPRPLAALLLAAIDRAAARKPAPPRTVHDVADAHVDGLTALLRAQWREVARAAAGPQLAAALAAKEGDRAVLLVRRAVEERLPAARKAVAARLLRTVGEAGALTVERARKSGWLGKGRPKKIRAAFDPDQPRDESGKWSEAGGSGGSGESSGSFARSGDALGTLYHGGKNKITEIDPSRLQGRDYGFYGQGFYVTQSESYAKSYGHVISRFTVDPNAKVLISELDPQKADPALVAAVKDWYTEKQLPAAIERGRGDAMREYISKIGEPGSYLEWKNAVTSFGFNNGFDVIRHSSGEIVVRNPSVLIPVAKSRKHLRAAASPFAMEFDYADPRAVKWAEERAGLLITDPITAEQLQAIQDAVARSIATGQTADELANEIEGLIGLRPDQLDQLDAAEADGATPEQLARLEDQLLGERADLIARTESIAAANAGQLEAWRQGDLGGELKRWIPDPVAACDRCIGLGEADPVPVDQPFVADDGEEVDGPPLHPKCRCSMGLAIPDGYYDAPDAEAAIDEGA